MTPHRPWAATRFTALVGCRWPIVQGPMGGGFSGPPLVAAVCEAGALGALGAYHLPPEEIGEQIAEIRRRTARPFLVNLWVPHPAETAPEGTDVRAAVALLAPYRAELALPPLDAPPASAPHDFGRQVEAVLRAGAPALSFTFGAPPRDVVADARRRGTLTVGVATTVDEAEAVEASGADMVCASGFEGGGHRGSFLRAAEDSLTGLVALVPQVRDAVRIPVIAAGGLADGRGVAAALALGADAAQLGTAFLAAPESGAGALHRAALADARRARDTTLTRAFSGRLARALANRATREIGTRTDALAPWPLQGALGRDLRRAAEDAGRDDLSSMYAGQGAPLVTPRAAADLVAALCDGVDDALRRLHA